LKGKSFAKFNDLIHLEYTQTRPKSNDLTPIDNNATSSGVNDVLTSFYSNAVVGELLYLCLTNLFISVNYGLVLALTTTYFYDFSIINNGSSLLGTRGSGATYPNPPSVNPKLASF
jgi:hypothetical protein